MGNVPQCSHQYCESPLDGGRGRTGYFHNHLLQRPGGYHSSKDDLNLHDFVAELFVVFARLVDFVGPTLTSFEMMKHHRGRIKLP
mmetsp:Transcript_6409/g.10040  ORF Transcript_6409/g.10040 Transcript_6409/m.10040 type:complete len:85 (+) Transcript_6409:1694-1948(+)